MQYRSSFFRVPIGKFYTWLIFSHNQRLWWLWQISGMKTALIYPRTIIALSMLHRTKLKCLDYVGGGDIYSHREFSIEPFNPSSNPILYLLSAQVPHTIHFGKYGIFLLLHNKGQPRSFRSPFSLRGAVKKMVEFESQITLSGIKPFGPRIPNLPISLVASLCDDDDNSDDDYEYDDDEWWRWWLMRGGGCWPLYCRSSQIGHLSHFRLTFNHHHHRCHHYHHHHHRRRRHGLPAHSHHDKKPPWWEFVSNEYGGNMPVTKSHHMITMMMILGWGISWSTRTCKRLK